MSEQTEFKVGDRVEMVRTWVGWKYSHHPKGMRGTVTEVYDTWLVVKFDVQPHAGTMDKRLVKVVASEA